MGWLPGASSLDTDRTVTRILAHSRALKWSYAVNSELAWAHSIRWCEVRRAHGAPVPLVLEFQGSRAAPVGWGPWSEEFRDRKRTQRGLHGD